MSLRAIAWLPLPNFWSSDFQAFYYSSHLKLIQEFGKSLNGETKVILEHTGRYYESVVHILHDAGIFVYAVNPKFTKDYGNNSLRRVKNDKAYSLKIACYGFDNWSELRRYTRFVTNSKP